MQMILISLLSAYIAFEFSLVGGNTLDTKKNGQFLNTASKNDHCVVANIS